MERKSGKRRGRYSLFGGRLRRWILFAALCAVIAVCLRLWVVEGYVVPTGSMEPLLHGDREGGDHVAVFKLFYKLFEARRFDLVVFEMERNRLGGSSAGEGSETIDVVKRVVGFPGETIRIKGGDLFVSSPGGGRENARGPRRVRKPLDLVRSLLIPFYRARFDGPFFEDWKCYRLVDNDLKEDPGAVGECCSLEKGQLILDAREPPFSSRGFALTFGREIDDGYLDDAGEVHRGSAAVKDLSLTMECELLSGGAGALYGELHAGVDSFGFELFSRDGGGGGRVSRGNGAGRPRTIGADRFPGLERGEPCTIQFLNVDGRVALLADGEVLDRFDYEEGRTFRSVSLYNSPSFGARGLKVAFRSLKIDRDIHYTGVGSFGCRSPFTIPAGFYFVLGDNSGESGDSRTFGPIPVKSVVGRPFMVFYPFRRFRVL